MQPRWHSGTLERYYFLKLIFEGFLFPVSGVSIDRIAVAAAAAALLVTLTLTTNVHVVTNGNKM